MSSSSFYRILWKTIEAINNCSDPYIKIKFPKTEPECNTLAKGFMSVSTNGCIQNCVAAIDGYLLAINAPAKKKMELMSDLFFQDIIRDMESTSKLHVTITAGFFLLLLQDLDKWEIVWHVTSADYTILWRIFLADTQQLQTVPTNQQST
jgi:hypothetical protein